MAKRGAGGRPGGTGSSGRGSRSDAKGGKGAQSAKGGKGAQSAKKRAAPATSSKVVFDAPAQTVEPRTFRLGAVPGATPGTWIARWRERMPQVALELIPISAATQRQALDSGEIDAALVRLPIDRDGLEAITLYDEVPVVVAAADSVLTAAEELSPGDLEGEVLIVPRDDVLGSVEVPGAVSPSFHAPDTTEDAIEIVATGVGVVIVPMSLARLHHRKDVASRPLVGGPTSTVALAWLSDATSSDVEAFVGIVRGRTANSSR